MAQNPEFLKPRDVSDLPPKRIDYAQTRPHQLLAGQVADQLERSLAGLAQGLDQYTCRRF